MKATTAMISKYTITELKLPLEPTKVVPASGAITSA